MASQHNTAGKKRVRTASQLQRKRTLDKEVQKKKREQQKEYVESLESSLQDARDEIQRLRALTQDPRGSAEAGAPTTDLLETSTGIDCPTDRDPQPRLADNKIGHASRAPSPPLQCRQWTIECYCTPQIHSSYSQCFEETVFDNLVKFNRHLAPTTAPSPTPDLADILCIREPRNPISQILHKLSRRPNTDNLILQSAVYIIAYRLLRYRLFPSLETFNDVPEWLQPTDIQNEIPHAIYIDFVQFPRLRNAMVLGHVSISRIREEFDNDFGRYLCVNWPSSESLMVTDHQRNTVINPNFVRHVCLEENWSLSPVFARKYPDIAPLVTTSGPRLEMSTVTNTPDPRLQLPFLPSTLFGIPFSIFPAGQEEGEHK